MFPQRKIRYEDFCTVFVPEPAFDAFDGKSNPGCGAFGGARDRISARGIFDGAWAGRYRQHAVSEQPNLNYGLMVEVPNAD